MRRTLSVAGIIGVAAFAAANLSGSTKLAEMSKTLLEAKSLKVSYMVQTIGAPSSAYEVALKKPNLARVDSPAQTIVADGKELTVYDKAQKTFYRTPQSDSELRGLLSGDELNQLASFFSESALKNVSSRDLGSKALKGENLDVVETTTASTTGKVVTYYLSPADHLARKSQIEISTPAGKSTTIIDTKQISLNGDLPDTTFRFTAPAGSREVKPEEMTAKWYTSLEEAKKVAASTKRMIFVDFFAEWCGPCKRLEADCFGTSEFKALSKKLVFLRIDVDQQPKVSQDYGIEAMPTQMVINANGTVINKTVGYANKTAFFNWIYGVVGR